jgi:hypothetical protein
MAIKITKTPCILAIFEDDGALLDGARAAREKGLKILDCFTPFPVHGIEKALGVKRSNLGIAAFVFGCFGFSVAMLLQTYVMKIDWPNNIGGKPTWPLASFVPLLFEWSVLFCSLGLAFTFFWICGMFPGVQPIIYEKRSTDDRFVLILDENGQGSEIRTLMMENGVVELRDDEYISHNFPGPLPLKVR